MPTFSEWSMEALRRRAKCDFLSNMPHGLRSPLNVILGFAHLIDQGSPAPTPNRKVQALNKF